MYMCECGKHFESYAKRNSHMSRCEAHLLIKYNGVIPERKKIQRQDKGYYRCECGKEFTRQVNYAGHLSKCEIYLGKELYQKYQENRRAARVKLNYEWSHSRTAESFIKQSNTRKEKYRNGDLIPAKGVGRGKYSYIIYNNRKLMLRSTYEFIFCFYLCYCGLDVYLEDTRVPASRVNIWSNTFISDFRINNIIIEVKGISSGKDYVAKESFEKCGFKYIILYKKNIDAIKTYLENLGFNINSFIEKINIGHNTKNYFTYTFPKLLNADIR